MIRLVTHSPLMQEFFSHVTWGLQHDCDYGESESEFRRRFTDAVEMMNTLFEIALNTDTTKFDELSSITRNNLMLIIENGYVDVERLTQNKVLFNMVRIEVLDKSLLLEFVFEQNLIGLF